MTIPYLIGDSMVYIGYIIVSCLQLGATIDYSILMTNNYLSERESHPPTEAAERAITRSALSILTSGSILTVVGYLLFFTSSIQTISQVGRLVGRGAILSMLLVLSLLPALLSVFDKQVMRQQAGAVARTQKMRAFWRDHLPRRKAAISIEYDQEEAPALPHELGPTEGEAVQPLEETAEEKAPCLVSAPTADTPETHPNEEGETDHEKV